MAKVVREENGARGWCEGKGEGDNDVNRGQNSAEVCPAKKRNAGKAKQTITKINYKQNGNKEN